MAKGLQMKTSNQTNLRGFIFRMLKPITRAIALAQGLAVILAAPAATAQTRPAATATNTVVSTAEVTAFMQSFRQGGLDAVSKISLNPKRVPLLLAAIEREPAGLWVTYLQGICFHVEHAAARKLPPARRSEVYARAIEYLAAAKETVSKALEADPQNRQLKHNLGTLDEGLALAYVESGTRIKEARALAEAVLAANTETNDWNYGNIIYDMHSLLGRIALREGDMAAAKRHLVESGKTPGSPQLNSFGPDFVLAGELLQKGERDVVLEHLDKIAVFWANPDRNPSRSSLALEHQKQIEKWKQTIRAGQIPDDNDYKWPVRGADPGGATNGAGIITSAGFIVTSGGFIAFTNAGSAENHEKEIEAWNREGATLTTEQARELEPKWVANPRDEPTLVRLLSYRLVHYGDEYPARANAEKVGRLYASLIEMDPYSSVAWAEGMSRLSPLVADPKCFEIIARKWIFLAKQNSNDNYIIKQAGTFLMLSPKDKSYFKQGESLLQQLAQRDPESALSYGNLCLDQAGPCFDRPEGDPKLAAKALIALQNAEKLMPAKSREHVQPGLFSSLTKAAFWAGQYPLAEKYAGRWLKEVRQRSADSAGLAPNRRLGQEMDLGDAIHQANSILGEIALSRGDTKRAAEHLVASGKVATPSPSLASYGPDLALMKDLLALKEKRAVLEFLDECGSFWHGSEGRPASWKQAIESGNNPDFGAGFKTHFKRLK